MSFSEIFKSSKLIESIENYAISDVSANPVDLEKENNVLFFESDKQFWDKVGLSREKFFSFQADFFRFTLSNWVARIPGYYWTESAVVMRKVEPGEIAKQSRGWQELIPSGKSKKVIGGIGTLLFPPDDQGRQLMSLSAGCNASSGIPALVYPEVISSLNLKQGDCIDIHGAKWCQLDLTWSKQFPCSGGIPRGYIVLDDPQQITVAFSGSPVEYHPFSILEYQSNGTLLYDFAYFTADTLMEDSEKQIIDFFEYYALKDGRNGQYLLNPNMVKPLFETRYNTPEELRSPIEKAKLNLMYERIRKHQFSKVNLENLLILLPKYYSTNLALVALARRIGINAALIPDDSAASVSSFIINECLKTGHIEVLVDTIASEHSTIFKN